MVNQNKKVYFFMPWVMKESKDNSQTFSLASDTMEFIQQPGALKDVKYLPATPVMQLDSCRYQ